MRVFMKPGAYAFTVIPYLPKSEASKILRQQIHESWRGELGRRHILAAWVKPRIANLDALYAEAMAEPAVFHERNIHCILRSYKDDSNLFFPAPEHAPE